MLIDKHHVVIDDADECDKIGTSYAAFYAQGQRCNVQYSACLNNQLDDFYNEDKVHETDGTVGDHFLQFHSTGGEWQTMAPGADGPAMVFRTTRFQKSVVTLELAADAVRYTVNT